MCNECALRSLLHALESLRQRIVLAVDPVPDLSTEPGGRGGGLAIP